MVSLRSTLSGVLLMVGMTLCSVSYFMEYTDGVSEKQHSLLLQTKFNRVFENLLFCDQNGDEITCYYGENHEYMISFTAIPNTNAFIGDINHVADERLVVLANKLSFADPIFLKFLRTYGINQFVLSEGTETDDEEYLSFQVESDTDEVISFLEFATSKFDLPEKVTDYNHTLVELGLEFTNNMQEYRDGVVSTIKIQFVECNNANGEIFNPKERDDVDYWKMFYDCLAVPNFFDFQNSSHGPQILKDIPEERKFLVSRLMKCEEYFIGIYGDNATSINSLTSSIGLTGLTRNQIFMTPIETDSFYFIQNLTSDKKYSDYPPQYSFYFVVLE